MSLILFFSRWKRIADQQKTIRSYNKFCELNNERLEEELFAQETKMDSSEWCWNCKYSDCERHPSPVSNGVYTLYRKI